MFIFLFFLYFVLYFSHSFSLTLFPFFSTSFLVFQQLQHQPTCVCSVRSRCCSAPFPPAVLTQLWLAVSTASSVPLPFSLSFCPFASLSLSVACSLCSLALAFFSVLHTLFYVHWKVLARRFSMSSDCLPACLSFCLSVRPSLHLPVRLCCCLAVWLSAWMLSSLARSSTLCFLINLAIFCQLFERFGEAPAAPETEHVVGNRVSSVRAGYTGCVRAQGYAKVIDSSNFSFGFGFCFAFCFGCDSFNSFFFLQILCFINFYKR